MILNLKNLKKNSNLKLLEIFSIIYLTYAQIIEEIYYLILLISIYQNVIMMMIKVKYLFIDILTWFLLIIFFNLDPFCPVFKVNNQNRLNYSKYISLNFILNIRSITF